MTEVDVSYLLNRFYENQISIMPQHCENCGMPIYRANGRLHVCHIVPKSKFKSVMVHPMNRWFGCWNCHADYDRSWAKAMTMAVWPVVVERFRVFMKDIVEKEELRRLPDSLRELIKK